MNSNNSDKNLHAWDILCQKATKTRDQTSQFADIPKGTLNVWYASDVHLHSNMTWAMEFSVEVYKICLIYYQKVINIHISGMKLKARLQKLI